MRTVIAVLALSLLPVCAEAQTPQWAFPTGQDTVPKAMRDAVVNADTAARKIAFPQVPASAPQLVREGRNGRGTCQGCHLPDGYGAPQSAPLAGLPAAYFMNQIANFSSGARGSAYRKNMADFAKKMSVVELSEIANYYASIHPMKWIDVRETDTVPKTFVGPREITALDPAGGTEPLGERIVEVSRTPSSPYEHNGMPAYIVYVPKGSVAQGAELVNRGVGKTIACTLCHGATLTGQGDVPGIAGRSAISTARQLFEFREGTRGGASGAPMVPVAAKLSDADVIAIAAYLASLPPS